METIYNTYVEMQNQEQCNRMRKLCVDNSLPIPYDYKNFQIDENNNLFHYTEFQELFFVFSNISNVDDSQIKISEEEFIKLLQQE